VHVVGFIIRIYHDARSPERHFLNVGPYRSPLDNFVLDQTVGCKFRPLQHCRRLTKETPAIESQWYIVIFITLVKNIKQPLSIKSYDSGKTCQLVWEEF